MHPEGKSHHSFHEPNPGSKSPTGSPTGSNAGYFFVIQVPDLYAYEPPFCCYPDGCLYNCTLAHEVRDKDMSRQNNNGKAQTSCLSNQMMSLWIWFRESTNSQLKQRSAILLAEGSMTSVRDNIMQKRQRLHASLKQETAELNRGCDLCKGNKTNALQIAALRDLIPQLQRVKRIKAQIHTANQQLSLLEGQIEAFETGRLQKEMAESLQHSVSVMKSAGVDSTRNEQILDSLHDTLQQQAEVSEQMQLPLQTMLENTNSMAATSNDEELLHELMAMMQITPPPDMAAPSDQAHLDTGLEEHKDKTFLPSVTTMDVPTIYERPPSTVQSIEETTQVSSRKNENNQNTATENLEERCNMGMQDSEENLERKHTSYVTN